MKKVSPAVLLMLPAIFFFGVVSGLHAQTMSDYCQVPPFVSSGIEPNVLLVNDVSGSTSWCAYNTDSGRMDCCTSSGGCGWTFTGNEEGYFLPSGTYQFNSSQNLWEESAGVPTACPQSQDPQYQDGVDPSKIYTGSCLNFLLMTRIDLIRWAMTGGTPDSCNGTNAFDAQYCDPELWNQPGNDTKVGLVCNDALGGCILLTYNGTRVKVPWSRINEGLVFKLNALSIKLRLGAMFYGTSVRSEKVYIGDFTGPNTADERFPYKNLIAYINSSSPNGLSSAGPAMWDALNYFSQETPQFGGFAPMSGAGDQWKNPMYFCTGEGTDCELVPCSKNFVILMSDGQWNLPNCSIGSNFSRNISADPVVPAYQMHRGFRNAATSVDTQVSNVYTIGMFLNGTGEQSLKNIAMYGSFDTTGRIWPGSLSGYPSGSCTMEDCGISPGAGSACTPLPASSRDWDRDGDGVPDAFFNFSTATGIRNAILDAVSDILQKTSSGTAVSVLASGEGTGANFLQALFFPKKSFRDVQIDWIGEMQNLWFYNDPGLNATTVREDTVSDSILNLKDDFIVRFIYDPSTGNTRANRFRDDGTATGAFVDVVEIEDLRSLWEAGGLLRTRDPFSRRLLTSTDGISLIPFSDSSASGLQNLLMASSQTEAEQVVRYILGVDRTGFRSRSVSVPSDSTLKVWKLGDIVSSTPRVQSLIRLNTYNSEPPAGYFDLSYDQFINSEDYKKRGMVYVGANDGMLHAFRLGLLDSLNGPQQIAQLSGFGLGTEEWAYIPRNVLPYLKYLADPNYCHLSYLDATPYVFDASIDPHGCASNYWDCPKETVTNPDPLDPSQLILDLGKTSWRTILIGGMGLGGACRNITATCTDCVKTPGDGLGFSAYFAFDVTDPLNPTLLWEFPNPNDATHGPAIGGLGFSTSGPLIVRAGDGDKNGRWFAVFASGPTGPIDTGARQFLGRSDQNLRLFVLDIKTGRLLRTIDTGIPNAFGGFLFNTTIDTDRWNPLRSGNYKDDVFYVGYVKKSDADQTWTDGGVLRISTKEGTDPGVWVQSTLIEGAGPVTSAIGHLQDRKRHHLWLYFGTGRYFYKMGKTIDDADGQRRLFGIKDPCYRVDDSFDPSCTSSVSLSMLTDSTSSPPPTEVSNDGWFINLALPDGSSKAERVITNPLPLPSGNVLFTTFSPSSDICGLEGKTFLWAVGYNTGGTPKSGSLTGKAFIQVSSGNVQEINLKAAFPVGTIRTEVGLGGMPPRGQGLTAVVSPAPTKKILNIQEQ